MVVERLCVESFMVFVFVAHTGLRRPQRCAAIAQQPLVLRLDVRANALALAKRLAEMAHVVVAVQFAAVMRDADPHCADG